MDQNEKRGKDIVLSEEDGNLSEVNGVADAAAVVSASFEEAGVSGEIKVSVAEDNDNFIKEVNGADVDANVGSASVEKAGVSGESKISVAEGDELDLKEGQKDGNTKIVFLGKHDQQGSNEVSNEPDQETSARNSVRAEHDTAVVIRSGQVQSQAVGVNERNKKPDFKDGKLASNKVLAQEPKKRVYEIQKDSCVIDMKCGSDRSIGEDGERVCRICHLGSGQSADTAGSDTTIIASGDLIHLGCACKDELGIAHSQCAEAWFKLKGNRLCEICGETAINIAGIGDERFMEEWNERRLTGRSVNPSGRVDRWWRGQPFCNFLMACLVIAFVLPWFFRVNIF